MTREEAPKWFAEQMAVKLAENVHKGSWDFSSPKWLLERLKEEVVELEEAMQLVGQGDLKVDFEEVIREAADVGNFAMMIADKAAKLRDML